MDSKDGGLSSAQKQRQAAADIARRKVLMAYEQKEVNKAAEYIKKQESTPTSANTPLGTSATPVLKTVTNEDWKKYHTAWQDYYQKYYSEYYLNAAKEYVARTQVKAIREKAAEEEAKSKYGLEKATKTASDSKEGSVIHSQADPGEKKIDSSLKARIQARAVEKVKSSRRRRLTPIFAGLAVVFTILFLQYNRLIFAPIAAYVSPGDSPAEGIAAVDPTVTLTKVSSENKLIIPKINVDVPLNFGVGLDGVMNAMNYGVVHYRINGASAYPGEAGNFVVMGHSAGDIYSSNQYKFIFSGLERLEEGDIMYVHYNSTRYVYRMVGRDIVWPNEVAKLRMGTDRRLMTLVTCWPLGTSRQRLFVIAELINNPTEVVQTQDDTTVETETKEVEMPQNEDTLFERIWKALFGE